MSLVSVEITDLPVATHAPVCAYMDRSVLIYGSIRYPKICHIVLQAGHRPAVHELLSDEGNWLPLFWGTLKVQVEHL